jgi:hypothetical protein
MNMSVSAEAPEPPSVLVRAFLDASLDALEFLVEQSGFQSTVTIEQASDAGIVEVAPDVVTGLFWARRGFSTTRLTGTMTYGERELEVNLLVDLVPSERSADGPYGLWEWMAVLGIPTSAESVTNPSWCATARRVRTAVAALGVAFRDSAPRIAAADPELVRQLERNRARRWTDDQAEHARVEEQTVVARATDAFRAGDYRRVVSLLAPLEVRLTAAARMKLALARKRL